MFILGFISLIFLGPRFVTVLWWLLQPARFSLAFPNFLIGILGIVFIPWTTLMYVLVAPGGIVGFDWFWIGIMLIADISSYVGGGFSGKKHLSSGSKSKTETPATPKEE